MSSTQLFTQIAEFGKKLMANDNMEDALELISAEARELVNAERCSIFMVDAEANMLWSKHSDGIGRIAIGLDSGIVGDTYKRQESQIVNHPYQDDRFMDRIDAKSGFITRNMVCVPIFDSKREVIGIIQILNRREDEFTTEDADKLAFLANYVSGTLELSLLTSE